MKNIYKLLTKLLFFSILLSGITNAMNLYDNNVSNVVNLNPKNFDTQIIHNRSKNIVSIVHFYKLDGNSSYLKKMGNRVE